MSRSNGGQAFPFGQTSEASGQLVNGWGSEGMSLRDYFAAKVMASTLAVPEYVRASVKRGRSLEETYRQFAADAYMAADAMLAERAKGGDQ